MFLICHWIVLTVLLSAVPLTIVPERLGLPFIVVWISVVVLDEDVSGLLSKNINHLLLVISAVSGQHIQWVSVTVPSRAGNDAGSIFIVLPVKDELLDHGISPPVGQSPQG